MSVNPGFKVLNALLFTLTGKTLVQPLTESAIGATGQNNNFLNDELNNLIRRWINEMYDTCRRNSPNFDVRHEVFRAAIRQTVGKYLVKLTDQAPTAGELRAFLNQLHCDDLFLSLACVARNLRARREFDEQHRAYIERVAAHLAGIGGDSQTIVADVYAILEGTPDGANGEGISKFANYSGRGSLRGWLRTVIRLSYVTRQLINDEKISPAGLTAHSGAKATMSNSSALPNRRSNPIFAALAKAFESLTDFERLILMYYHLDNLRIGEIARFVANKKSSSGNWLAGKLRSVWKNFFRPSPETTLQQWLEKCYRRVWQTVKSELAGVHKFNDLAINNSVPQISKKTSAHNFYQNSGATNRQFTFSDRETTSSVTQTPPTEVCKELK